MQCLLGHFNVGATKHAESVAAFLAVLGSVLHLNQRKTKRTTCSGGWGLVLLARGAWWAGNVLTIHLPRWPVWQPAWLS